MCLHWHCGATFVIKINALTVISCCYLKKKIAVSPVKYIKKLPPCYVDIDPLSKHKAV